MRICEIMKSFLIDVMMGGGGGTINIKFLKSNF